MFVKYIKKIINIKLIRKIIFDFKISSDFKNKIVIKQLNMNIETLSVVNKTITNKARINIEFKNENSKLNFFLINKTDKKYWTQS